MMKLATLLALAAGLNSISITSAACRLQPDQPAADTAWQRVNRNALSESQQKQLAKADAARKDMFGQLLTALSTAIAQNGAPEAIDVCSNVAPETAISVATEYGVKIGRTSWKLRNPSNSPPAWARPLVDERVTEPTIMADRDGHLGILSPIRINAACIQCHGPKDQIAPRVLEQLDNLYPDDQATGFKDGDLRGWFWVEVPPTPETTPSPQEPASGSQWWRDAVFYEIFVRSFADSTTGPLANDGVGDLRGIIERLDYLNDGDPNTTDDLGVTALWLMPIAQSPSYHGYDVVDYKSIDDEYGTIEDFRELAAAAHERGMRIIVDTVINHSSSEHPWFQEAIDRDSPKHDWFVWADTPPTGPGAPNHTVWHDDYLDRNGQYFYGFFWHEMPDFNLRNAEATDAIYDFSRFWLTDMNADGLRLDAIKHLIEDGVIFENTPETTEWLNAYNKAMHQANPEAFIVGEVWADTATIARFMDGGVDSAFAFPLADAIVESLKIAHTRPVRNTIKEMVKTGQLDDFATFIGNHDMDRVIDRLGSSRERAAAAATILLNLPGIPFIYYGEEIGMRGTKPDPDIRTPMQWTPDPETAGFTAGKPWREPNSDTPTVNVEAENAEPDSLLNLYRNLIRLRTGNPALAGGSFDLIFGGHDAVLAWVRESENQRLLVIVNLSSNPVADYRISGTHGQPVRELLHGRGVTDRVGYPILELKPYTGYVIELMDTRR